MHDQGSCPPGCIVDLGDCACTAGHLSFKMSGVRTCRAWMPTDDPHLQAGLWPAHSNLLPVLPVTTAETPWAVLVPSSSVHSAWLQATAASPAL